MPTRVGEHRRGGVVEHVPAHVGQRLGLPLPGAAVVLGGERRGVGVDHRGDRVEHRGVVEPALHLPAAVREPGQEQLVHPGRGPVVGLLTVLIQQFDQRRAPLRAARCGVYWSALPASCASAPAQASGESRPAGLLRQDPGDHLDVPQPGAARREHLRGRGQPRRQHAAVEPGARCRPARRRSPGGGPRTAPSRAGRSTPAPPTCSRARRTRHAGPARPPHPPWPGPAAAPPTHTCSATPPTRRRCSTRPRRAARRPPAPAGAARQRTGSRSRTHSRDHHRQNRALRRRPGEDSFDDFGEVQAPVTNSTN